MPEPLSILIVGVGGQGTILAGKVLSHVGLLAGRDIKFSEIHGMAQRGGSVVTQVRLGDAVSSPIIEAGEAGFILAFEQLEGLRWMHMLRPGGLMIVSSQVIEPMPVIMGVAAYPGDALDQMRARGRTHVLDALAIAQEAGNARASNIVLLGHLARQMDLDRALWDRALAETTPARFLDANRRAFDAGWGAAPA